MSVSRGSTVSEDAVSLRRAGRRHHRSMGRAHKDVAVIELIDDLDIRVIATDTGELPRALTLNPTSAPTTLQTQEAP